MFFSNLNMILALIVMHAFLIAENAMVLNLNCWWLQPPVQVMSILEFFVSSCTNIVRLPSVKVPHVPAPHLVSHLGILHPARASARAVPAVTSCNALQAAHFEAHQLPQMQKAPPQDGYLTTICRCRNCFTYHKQYRQRQHAQHTPQQPFNQPAAHV